MNSETRSPLKVYIIRHGETEWTLSGQHTGSTDIPLTEHGEEEATALAQLVSPIKFDHVFTSPLQRAHRTAELALPGMNIKIEPDLEEWNYGDYEGITSEDILRTKPGWNIYRDGCPNGESPDHVCARADRLWARILDLEGNVVLVSHGQFGSILAARWIGLQALEAEHFLLDTASYSVLGFAVHHPDVPVITHWNISATVLPGFVNKTPLPAEPEELQRWDNEGGDITVRDTTLIEIAE